MTALLRILFAIVLLVSSSLSLAAMAADGAMVHDVQARGEHTQHQHDGPESGHESLDCGMAVCCFMFATAEPAEPATCSLTLPQAAASVPELPERADKHEHPPRQG